MRVGDDRAAEGLCEDDIPADNRAQPEPMDQDIDAVLADGRLQGRATRFIAILYGTTGFLWCASAQTAFVSTAGEEPMPAALLRAVHFGGQARILRFDSGFIR